jgi:hypothetical protein
LVRWRWFGQSAFELRGSDGTVFVDPFGSMDALKDRGIEFRYPAIEGVDADLLLVTHEARWIVPMHYRNEAFGAGFLNPVDPFLERFERVLRLDGPELDSDNLTGDGAVLLPAVPIRK